MKMSIVKEDATGSSLVEKMLPKLSVLPPFKIHYKPATDLFYICGINYNILNQPLHEFDELILLKDLGIDKIMNSFRIYTLVLEVFTPSILGLLSSEQRHIIGCHITHIIIRVKKVHGFFCFSLEADLQFEREMYDEITRLADHEIEPGMFE
jgi:hypothetical protein